MGRCLVLVDILNLDAVLPSIMRGCSLKTLMIRSSGLSAQSIEAVGRCEGLEILKLSLEEKAVQDPFIRVFTACQLLRVVDIHGATDVSDQILGCLMLNA